MQSEKNSTACTSHNLQTTVEPNVSVLWTAWKLRGGAATCHDGRGRGRGEGKREKEIQTNEEERNGGRGKKETRYILYDSVIAFPRTNIAPAERTQENVDVNRRRLLFSASLSLSLARSIPLPCNLFVLYRFEISLGEDVCKMLTTTFCFSLRSRLFFSKKSSFLTLPIPRIFVNENLSDDI